MLGAAGVAARIDGGNEQYRKRRRTKFGPQCSRAGGLATEKDRDLVRAGDLLRAWRSDEV
jgi:hypothetical protein